MFKIKFWPLLIDVGVILLCVLFCEWRELDSTGTSMLMSMVAASGTAFGLIPQAVSVGQVAALLFIPVHSLLFYIAGVIIGCYFVPVAYFAFIKARLQANLHKKLHATEQDLYYFRDTFPGMKPATVSMLMDLEIETKKDVSASLLQMVKKGLLAFGGQGFVPADTSADMSKSEAELIRLVSGETSNLSHWKDLSIQEAIASGYLEKTGLDEIRLQVKKYWRTWLICLAVAFTLGVGITQATDLDFFGRLAVGMGDMVAFQQTSTFALDVLLSLLFWPVAAAMTALIALPVYIFFFQRRYEQVNAPVRLTAYGKRAARQLYGIKNYIHDFTLLDEATKEKVILWDDFLVYAIVLEENKDIVNKIGRYYPSIKLSALQL